MDGSAGSSAAGAGAGGTRNAGRRLSIGPIFFYNPEKYKNTPFLLKIGRISVRVKPKSFLPWAKKEAPMDVENVEIEGMKLHLERDGKGGLNVWAALGMTDEEGNAMTNDVQKTDDATKAEIDAFEEDGTSPRGQSADRGRGTPPAATWIVREDASSRHAAAARWIVPGDESRRRRGCDADSPRDESQRRRGCDADSPLDGTPRPRRG